MQEVGTVVISSDEYRALVARVTETKDYEQINKRLNQYLEFMSCSGNIYHKNAFVEFISSEKGEKDNG